MSLPHSSLVLEPYPLKYMSFIYIYIYTVAQCKHCYHQMALTRQAKKQPKPIQPTLASSQIKPWFQGQSHEAEILIANPPPSCLPGSPSQYRFLNLRSTNGHIYPNTRPFQGFLIQKGSFLCKNIIPMDILLHSVDIVLRLISASKVKRCVTGGNGTNRNKLDYKNEAKKELPYEKQFYRQFSSTLTALTGYLRPAMQARQRIQELLDLLYLNLLVFCGLKKLKTGQILMHLKLKAAHRSPAVLDR